MIFCETLTPGYAMLMSPNKDETAVHGCGCPGDMAVRMRKVLAIPRSFTGEKCLIGRRVTT